jgi:hypothetical protein
MSKEGPYQKSIPHSIKFGFSQIKALFFRQPNEQKG